MELSGTEEALPSVAVMAGTRRDREKNLQRPLRLPKGRKASYGAGQLIELTVESTMNIFVLFYATAVCGLPGGLAGLAIGAGVVIDAIVNPLIGSLSDGWRSRFGRRVPFMAISLVPIILTFNLIFALPSGLGQMALFLWLMLLSVSLRVALSLFTVPYLAMGAELTDDYNERSSVAAWRWGIGILGTVAVILLGYGVFFAGPGGTSQRDAYLPLTMTLSLILLIGAAAAIRQGLMARSLTQPAEAPVEAIHLRLFDELREIFRSRTFRVLFAAGLLFNIEAGIHQALGLHVITYFWQLQAGQIQTLGMVSVLGLIIAAPLAGPLLKRFEKRTMLIFSMIGMVTCHALPATLKLLGLMPFTGHALIGFLAAIALAGGALMAMSIISFVSIIPDAADKHEYDFGTRREGLYFAGWSFATKAATGAGVLVAGLVLQLVDFPRNLAEQGPAAILSKGTAELLAFAHGPGAALLSLGGIAMVLFYRIDRQTHGRIITELTARRGASGASPAGGRS